jgi:hypothetical protein
MLESGTGVLSLPDVISVFESTDTVTDWPFSDESWGPVQSTPTVSEFVPTALTEPANQCEWDRAGVVVVVVVVVGVGDAASAGSANAATSAPATSMGMILRIVVPPIRGRGGKFITPPLSPPCV